VLVEGHHNAAKTAKDRSLPNFSSDVEVAHAVEQRDDRCLRSAASAND
jgi:hypothetical protein